MVSDGLDGKSGGTVGGITAGDEPDHDAEGECHHHRLDRQDGSESGQGSGAVDGRCERSDEVGQPNPDSNADEPTEAGQDDGFD
jgi:hypothetical protein